MRAESEFGKFHRGCLLHVIGIGLVLTASFAATSVAQQKGQKTFATPEAASQALLAAAKSNDEKALLEVLGPDAKDVISSGDADEDTHSRQHFVKRYEEMSRLVQEPDGTVSLYIGERNWPYPIPLRKKNNVWYFDTEAGKTEILYRRVGYNEVSAIHICDQLVAAQKEYYGKENSQYAQKIFSDEGKQDGLYWKAENGQPQSPIGPLVAWAVADEYAKSRGGQPVPYRGYYFHVLTAQGKNVSGGAKNYIVDGKMTQGFAFVAYPAMYRTSGVMTFLVNSDGVIYEKDLGKKTEEMAQAMKEFNPDSHWRKVEGEQQETASAGTQAPK